MTPLFALHGMMGLPSMFDGLATRPSYAPVLPGHGPSPDLSRATFESVTDDWAHQLESRFGADPVDVLGYSLGGRYALAFCARHPQRFRRAVLVSAHPGLAEDDRVGRAERLREDEAEARMLEADGLAAFVAAWEKKPLFASQTRVDESLQAAQRAARRSHTAHGLAFSLRHFGLGRMPCWERDLAVLAPRIAYLAGAADEKFAAIGARLATSHPALTVEILPGIGHNPFFEAPALTRVRLAALFHPPAASSARRT